MTHDRSEPQAQDAGKHHDAEHVRPPVFGHPGTNSRRTLQRDVATLARMVGNRAFCRLVQRDPLPPPNRQIGVLLKPGVEWVELARVEYTQPRVSFTTSEGQTLGRMARDMAKNGWNPLRPADIVRTTNGRLVSLDHRRMFAADRAGLTAVTARVHGEEDKLSGETAVRFAIRRGQVPHGNNPRTKQPWKANDRPATWGDVIRFRAAVQDFYDPVTGRPMKEPIMPQELPGGSERGGTRDPRFPREGSPNMPARMPPRPRTEKPEPEPPAPEGGGAPPAKFEAPQEGNVAPEKPTAASGRDEPHVAEPGGPHVEVDPEGGGVEPTGEGMAPGAEGKGATTSAVEGGAMAGEQKGIEKLEHAEDEKAQEDFKRHEPTVRRLTAEGNWVVVKSWFDAPRAPNLLASVYKERSDIAEFLYTTIQSGATRDEARRGTPSQLKQRDYGLEEAPPPETTSKDRKAVARDVREFEPDPPGEQLVSAYADFIGTYRPSNLDQEGGDITPLRRKGWHRELKLRAGSSSDPSTVVQMWTTDDRGEKTEWQTVWISGNDPVKGIFALFIQRAPNGTALYSIQSEIHYMYTPGGDRLFEHAKGKSGEGTTPSESWSAVFTWTQANQSK